MVKCVRVGNWSFTLGRSSQKLVPNYLSHMSELNSFDKFTTAFEETFTSRESSIRLLPREGQVVQTTKITSGRNQKKILRWAAFPANCHRRYLAIDTLVRRNYWLIFGYSMKWIITIARSSVTPHKLNQRLIKHCRHHGLKK